MKSSLQLDDYALILIEIRAGILYLYLMLVHLFRALLVIAAVFVVAPAWADHSEQHTRKWHDARGLPEQVLDQLDDLGMHGIDQSIIDHVAPHQSISKCNPSSDFTPEFLPSAAWDAWDVSPEELQGRSELLKTDEGVLYHPDVPWELGLQAYCEVIFNIDDEGKPIRTEIAARCTLSPYLWEALSGVLSMRFEAASDKNIHKPRERIVQPIAFCDRSPAFS